MILNHLRRNWLSKLLSLLAAIGLWIYVMSEQNPVVDVSYTVPVHLVQGDNNYIIENAPTFIRVELSGPRNTILHLDPHSLVATIDVQESKPGPHKLPINFSVPSGLRLLSMTPAQADIYLDVFAVRDIPLVFKATNELPKNTSFKTVQMWPQTITISGSKHRVDAISQAYIEGKVDVTNPNGKEPMNITGDVMLLDNKGQRAFKVDAKPQKATVSILVQHNMVDKRVGILPDVEGKPAEGYRVESVEVTPNQVLISGNANIINEINAIRTQPVDVEGAKETVRRTVGFVDDPNVTNTKELVEVTVNVVKIENVNKKKDEIN